MSVPATGATRHRGCRGEQRHHGADPGGAAVSSDTRERIVDSSAELFRRQGYNGTGVKQIAAAAAAPFGSLYHFFPGGKEQLGAEVIRTSGAMYMQLFATVVAGAPDAASAIGAFFAGAAETLHETGFADACPIATVALEVASTNEPLRIATARCVRQLDRRRRRLPRGRRHRPAALARAGVLDPVAARGRVRVQPRAAQHRAAPRRRRERRRARACGAAPHPPDGRVRR